MRHASGLPASAGSKVSRAPGAGEDHGMGSPSALGIAAAVGTRAGLGGPHGGEGLRRR